MWLTDFFGNAHVKTVGTDIIISGIKTNDLFDDIKSIWKNANIAKSMFKEIKKHSITIDEFFAPDIKYMFTQIHAWKHKKSNKYRLNQVIELIDKNTWMASTVAEHPDILDFSQLKNLHHTLFDHQIESLKVYNEKVPQMQLMGFLLSTPPGSGKTIMSIALGECLHADVRIYIVPKNTVTTVWYGDILTELPNARVWASDHGAPLTLDYTHYIFHYEALPLAIYLAKKLMGRRKKPFIAIDESHNLNEITSVRTLRLVELTKILNCQHTVFASGTPIKAIGTEAIPLLRCIDRFFTPEVEARFKAIYGLTAKRANDILRNRLGLISHKIAEDSYMKIPRPIEKELLVKVPDSKRFLITTIKAEMKEFMKVRYKYYQSNMIQYVKIYNQGLDAYSKTIRTSQERADFQTYRNYAADIIQSYDPVLQKEEAAYCKHFEKTKILPALPSNIRNQFKDSISVVKYAKLRVLGEALAVVGRKRVECATELGRYGNLEDIVKNADKKTIVFSSYIDALEVGYNTFIKNGFNAMRIYGQYTKDLTSLVTKFKTDPSVNPLFGTLQSLSASQTLTNANVVVFLNAPFREYIRDQAFHRVFRIGQDVQTYIYTCILDTGKEPNISTHTNDILKWSQDQVEAIIGSKLTTQDVDGIVQRLHLNQNASLLSGATDFFRHFL